MVAFALPVMMPARIVPTAMAVSFRYHHATAKQTGDNRCNDQLEFHNWSSSSTLVYPAYEHPAE